jgi:predicted secreted hydrolase
VLSRRRLLAVLAGLGLPVARAGTAYPAVVPRPLSFPWDFGAHEEFRSEWWYLTGWLEAADGPLGFQVTFFRARTGLGAENPSAFAARQLIIGHAALADPAQGRLQVDERMARAGFGLATAAAGDTDVALEGWTLRRDPATDTYACTVSGPQFSLRFSARATGPPWLQGDAGFSRKGPDPLQASYYYSRPHLEVRAELAQATRGLQPCVGVAWLDHEWSSQALAPEAQGWDWAGMHLADGSSLVAFQVRAREPAAAPLMKYAALRSATGAVERWDPAAVAFEPRRQWTSPRSGITWPVAQRISVGSRRFDTVPLLDDQELDSRRTTGAVYWEGASRLQENGQSVGRGYLELTGYGAPLTF